MKEAIDQRSSSMPPWGEGGGPVGKERGGLTDGVKGTARGPCGDR